ncbi:MAG: HEAT repeat domain-containing protein, partial [Planctomycetota bacterium]
PQQHIEISSAGTCLYRIEETPRLGERERRPGARILHTIDDEQLVRLGRLLEQTEWLTAPGGEGRASHTDAAEWTITLVRAGDTRTITCHGRRPEPYASLMRFFRGLAFQERRLYQLNWLSSDERREACEHLEREIEGLRGRSGSRYPLYDVDYERYRETFAGVMTDVLSRRDWEIITAVKLFTHLGERGYAEEITHLLRDRQYDVRRAAARYVADLGCQEAIPVLADVAGATDEAAWSLIRFGDPAIPTIVAAIERGMPDNSDSLDLVRAYLVHWRELPGPLDQRVVAAVRKGMAKTDRHWRDDYQALLELAAGDPPPSGPVRCLINQSWSVLPRGPVRLIHGWYTVVDGKIAEHGAAPAPAPGTARFGLLKFEPVVEGGRLKIQTGWQTARPGPTESSVRATAEVAWIDIPPGAECKRVYRVHQPARTGHAPDTVRIAREYTTLWEGWITKDGKPLTRLVYAARIARPDESDEAFTPPRDAAPARGELPKPPRPIEWRTITMNEATVVSDPAVLHNLAVALRYHAVAAAGGEPEGVSKYAVVYISKLKEPSGHHFAVLHDPKAGVFYIQAREGRNSKSHGPFKGDPYEKLNLPEKPVTPSVDRDPLDQSAVSNGLK